MIENYPWLEPRDKRKYMSDREILEIYGDFEKNHVQQIKKRIKKWKSYTNTSIWFKT